MTISPVSSFRQRPATRLGQWAAGLLILFLVLWIINSALVMRFGQDPASEGWTSTYLPYYGIFMLLCGLASGVVGLIAVIRKRERSWMVLLAILPGALMVFFLLGEFLIPH
jgi:hypothetical protein